MTSPLSIGFSTMWAASAAYSAGVAEAVRVRDRLAERLARLLGQRGEQRRVEQARGDRADADARAREVARGRQRHPDHAALRGRVGDLADLAVEGRDRGGVDDHAALAAVVGLVGEHRRGREAQHVEGADQVDRDRDPERLELVRAALAGDLLGPADARAADGDAEVVAGGGDRGLDLLGLGDVAARRSVAPSSSASASPFSALRSAIVTFAPARAQPPRGRRAEPGGAAGDECRWLPRSAWRRNLHAVAQVQIAVGGGDAAQRERSARAALGPSTIDGRPLAR